MLTNKYSPTSFSDVLSSDKIINIIKSPVNVILYGPAGSGKTTIVKTLTKTVKTNRYLVLNISDDRGINLIREDVMSFISIDCNNKVIILDEMDSLTIDAQNMLNFIMDNYHNDRNVRFIFVCNYINNINPSIMSKCVPLRINNIDPVKLIQRITYITNHEKIYMSIDSIEYIIRYYRSDIRKILNAIECIKDTYGNGIVIGIKCIKEIIQ